MANHVSSYLKFVRVNDAGMDFIKKELERINAAYAILCRDSITCTGNFYIDEVVLREEGVTDFNQYAVEPGADLFRDFFVPDEIASTIPTKTLSAY